MSSGHPELLFPAQPLALQPGIRSGSSGPGELLRQLEMPGWLGCGVWTGQPALGEPLLQRVDGACALVCASDKWLAFVLTEWVKMAVSVGTSTANRVSLLSW